MNGLSFPERYRVLHTFSFEYRRLRADLITMYRVTVRQDYPDLRPWLLQHQLVNSRK